MEGRNQQANFPDEIRRRSSLFSGSIIGPSGGPAQGSPVDELSIIGSYNTLHTDLTARANLASLKAPDA